MLTVEVTETAKFECCLERMEIPDDDWVQRREDWYIYERVCPVCGYPSPMITDLGDEIDVHIRID